MHNVVAAQLRSHWCTRRPVSGSSLFLRRLLTMLAHLHGGLLNASQLGSSLGVSHHAVQRYLDVLEQVFLIRRLAPYFRNVGKRLTRSPRSTCAIRASCITC
jgi:predicted AAA+ superfamily ATPase